MSACYPADSILGSHSMTENFEAFRMSVQDFHQTCKVVCLAASHKLCRLCRSSLSPVLATLPDTTTAMPAQLSKGAKLGKRRVQTIGASCFKAGAMTMIVDAMS